MVVGGGGSGLAAAIEARSLGRSVILLEKTEKLGGSTAWSVGSVTATSTPHQLARGIKDCPDHHFEDIGLFTAQYGLEENLRLRRILVDGMPDTFRWLMDRGIVFYGPIAEPPHRKPRMHNVLPNSRSFIYHLERDARRAGVEIRTGFRVERLLLQNGESEGVAGRLDGEQVTVLARGGVVLATGDFSGSPELRARFISPDETAEPVNPDNTGDGHSLVLALGGRIVHPQFQNVALRFEPPPRNWIMAIPPYAWLMRLARWALDTLPDWLLRPVVMRFMTTVLGASPNLYKSGAILINRRGERFTDELDPDIRSRDVVNQPEGRAYVLLDRRLSEQFSRWPNYVSTAQGVAYAYVPDYRRTRPDIFHRAATLQELAQKLGMSAGQLERTVTEFNAAAAGRGLPPLGDGPYVAMGPVKYYCNFTDSGVAVSDRLEVLGAEDKPVRRLYAAGFLGMGGTLFKGHGHHLGWAFTSGRLAGRHAAFDALSEDLMDANNGHGP